MKKEPLFDWLETRSAGVLLHPTSLPGPGGIGTLGAEARRFAEFLGAARFTWWQVCPLGPTGFGDSPYAAFSAFAGNPYLIDLAELQKEGLLGMDDWQPLRHIGEGKAAYEAQFQIKWPLLRSLYPRLAKGRGGVPEPYGSFEAFKENNAYWLDGYARFTALKNKYGGKALWDWPKEAQSAKAAREAGLYEEVEEEAESLRYIQYLFFGQWMRLREFAAERGVQIIGDIPIFVAGDSADVWQWPELFDLKKNSPQAKTMAGVPPDAFTSDGQLWGNPCYRWSEHKKDGYGWWLERLKQNFYLYDAVRIDHFRGFEAYWSVPAGEKTARNGSWKKGPGLGFLEAVAKELPQARLIAEDLGVITDETRELLAATGLPGMAVLQFAFDGNNGNDYLPHNHTHNSVLYTGTHDNDTSLGWYWRAPDHMQDFFRRYLHVPGTEAGWDMVRAAYQSVARMAVFPLQDLLSLGSEARFNTPGAAMGNWQWRFTREQFDQLQSSVGYLRELAFLYHRADSQG